MKILFVLENYFPKIGGVEKLFCQLAEKMAADGHDVTVLTSNSSGGLAPHEILNGVKIQRLKVVSRYLFILLAIFPAWKAAKQCDIIHTTSYNAALPAWVAAKLRRKRIYITFHEVWSKLWFELPYMNVAFRWLHYLYEQFLLMVPFDRYIAPSEFSRQALIESGIRAEKVSRIYNGLEPIENAQYEVGKSEGFLFFGRLGMSKGIDLILDAALWLKENDHRVEMRLVTTREPLYIYEAVMAFRQSNGLQDLITIEHELPYDQLQSRIANCKAVMVPSYSEGFGFAAVECMTMKVPVILSGKGALGEVAFGKVIIMEEFSGKGLAKAILKAQKDDYELLPWRDFSLDTTVGGYLMEYEKGLNL